MKTEDLVTHMNKEERGGGVQECRLAHSARSTRIKLGGFITVFLLEAKNKNRPKLRFNMVKV